MMNSGFKLARVILLGIMMLSGVVGVQSQRQRDPEPRQPQQWLNGLPGLTADAQARMQARLASMNPTGEQFQRTSYRPANYVPQTEPKVARNGKSAVEVLGVPRATFVVDHFFDDSDSPDVSPGDGICADGFGVCGLRTAVMEANALPGLDMITIPAEEIALSYDGADEDDAVSGDLDITDDLIIQGAGALSTIINADGLNDRVFHIFNGAVVDIYDVAIINGDTTTSATSQVGGGIWVHCSGDLLVSRANIGIHIGSWGGAIELGGCDTETSYLYIFNAAVYSSLANNAGGGIDMYQNAELYATNLTVGSNSAVSAPGGIFVEDGGTQVVVIDQSTIAGNGTAGGVSPGGGFRLLNDEPITVISDSIIAYNSVGGTPNDCAGLYTSASDNIYTIADGCTVTADDIVNPALVLFGLTAPGPGQVGVMPIDTTSDAWEKDDDFEGCYFTDARGVLRPEEINCDSGAFEVETTNNYPYPFELSTPADGSVINDFSTLTTFTWGAALDATDYDLEIYRTSDEPDSLIVTSNLTAAADSDLLTCDSDTCTLTVDAALEALLINGAYQWSVSANSIEDLSRDAFNNPFTFSVDVASELIQNGGFENLGGDGKPDITPWIVKNSSGDKAKCNKDKDGDGIPDKIVANTGECAFQFKNVVGEAGKLEQTLSFGSITPTVGDTLTLSVAGKTTGGALGKVKVVVKYGDDTKTKITADVDNPDAYAIESGNGSLTNTTIVKFKLSIKSSSTAGKVYVDDVSLLHESGGGSILIPLPPQANLRGRQ